MKTNKSFTKRMKITKKGKLLVGKPGFHHFNAKQTRAEQLRGKKPRPFAVKPKVRSRFIPGK